MSEDLGVVWDFDGTLAERPGLWSGCLLEVITEHDPDHRIVRQDISALMKTGFPWHTPERAHPDLCDPDAWWGEITTLLASVLERLGFATATARTLASRVRAHYVDANVGWRVFPETEEALRRLSERGCRQVILSNHAPELATLIDQLGLAHYFEAVVTSALTGFEKPHPGSYAAARELLPTADLWMIGDSEEADVLGPERNGIRGVLVWRKSTPRPQRVRRHAADLKSAVDLVLTDSER